ncbi:MAG: drug/metabolite transporter (DMT)-like permease [Candidatus Poriferisodalaceae bacterium]|jgi:drug/metabolite transporter (DMT)-like permease
MAERTRVASSGTNTGAFAPLDWVLLLSIAGIWGSSFLWIAIGLDHFGPGVIALARLAFGAAVLFFLPGARNKIDGRDWWTVAIIAVCGNAGPAILLATAQQEVDSAVAGMLNGSTPLFVVLVGLFVTRLVPRPRQALGLGIGFVGVLCMAYPNLVGSSATPFGISLILLTMLGYGVTNVVIVGMQQRYGGPPVVMRAQLLGALMMLPFFVKDLPDSEFDWTALGAILFLGVFGTGLARSMSATLSGRTGAARASVVTYIIPVVAITLGITVRGESIGPWEVVGTLLVLVGAYFTTRAERA